MKQLEMEWRRSKVLELSSQGYSEREISEIIKVNDTAVYRGMVYLGQQAQENLQKHIHETIPHEYQKAMVSFNLVQGFANIFRLAYNIKYIKSLENPNRFWRISPYEGRSWKIRVSPDSSSKKQSEY